MRTLEIEELATCEAVTKRNFNIIVGYHNAGAKILSDFSGNLFYDYKKIYPLNICIPFLSAPPELK